MKLRWWRDKLVRGVTRLIAHLCCLYACLALLLNSSWSDSIFHLTVNPLFSGQVHWERVSWGPYPWNIRIKDPKLIDAQSVEVARFKSVVIQDYHLMGLSDFTYSAGFIGVYDGHVNLLERPHSEDPHRLIWNIEELFKPSDSLGKIDDGELPPPVLVQLQRCELEDVRGRVRMGTVDVSVFGGEVRGGFFEIDTTHKVMRIRAEQLNVRQVNTDIFLRTIKEEMSPIEKSRAPIEKTLSYQHTQLSGRDVWWLGDAFGSRILSTISYQRDSLNLKSWVLDLSPQGVPHARGTLNAHLHKMERYIAPWGLDEFVRGELRLDGDLNGPLDDPATRGLNLEGQLFVPEIGSLRFQVDGEKSRSGLVSLSQGRVWSQLGDLGIKGNFDLSRRLGLVTLQANELIWSSITKLPPKWSQWEKSASGDVAVKLRPHYQLALEESRSQRPFAIGMEVDLSALGPRRVQVKARASLEADTLTLHQSLIELHKPSDALHAAPRQAIRAKGSVDLKEKTVASRVSLKGQLKYDSLPPLRLPLESKLDLKLEVVGPLSAPKVKGSIDASKLKSDFANYPWRLSTLKANFSFDHRELRLWDSELKTVDGAARFRLALPIKHPLSSTGWVQLSTLKLDLIPLGIPLATELNGVVCTQDDLGCADMIQRTPLSPSEAKDSCLATLYRKEKSVSEATRSREKSHRDSHFSSNHSQQTRLKHPKTSSAEACLALRELSFMTVDFREFELHASLTPDLIKLKRGHLWKSRRLLLDLQGQLENPLSQDPKLNATLKALNLPLQLIQKFVKDPPLSLRTLYGTASGHFDLNGSLKRPEGTGELSADRVSARIDLGGKRPPQLSLGQAELKLELSRDRITAKGHIGRHLWLDGEYLIDQPELSLGIDLYSLGISYLYASTHGERSYKSELKQIKSFFEKSANSAFAIAPLSLSDPDQALTLIGLGDELYCDWTTRGLPLGQLIRIGLQGRAQLSWKLDQKSIPKLDLDLDDTRVDYWLRDIGGDVIRHEEEREGCLNRCRLRVSSGSSRTQGLNKKPASCPSLSLHTPNRYRVSIGGDEQFGETIWVNPKKTWLKNELKLDQAQELNTQKEDRCPQLSFMGDRTQEKVRLMPMVLESGGQRLELKFGLIHGQALGCLRGHVRLNILTPFLRDIYQQVDGDVNLDTQFSGPLSELRLVGNAELSALELLSPRVKLLGDLHLLEPTKFRLDPLEPGGTRLSLATGAEINLTRNEGTVKVNDLTVELPRFILNELAVGFSAPQFDLLIPQMIRASMKLNEMRFEMSIPTSDFNESPYLEPINGKESKEESERINDERDELIARDERRSNGPKLALSGDIKVIRALYHADLLSLDKTFYQGGLNALAGQTAVETLSVFDTSPILKGLSLDLKLEGDNEILVKSQIADLTKIDLELTFELKIRGKLITERGDDLKDRLSLSGYVNALEGSTLTISKNPFEISHAKVLFGGELSEESQTSDFLFADLIASRTFRIPPTGTNSRQINFDQTLSTDLVDEEVTLNAQLKMASQESPFQIDFDLMSQSGRSRIEILNLILFGSYPTGIGVLDNTQPATGLLLSPVLNFIERPIADSLGLDNLSLTPDSSSLFIDIDKVFSRRLRFNLRTQIGELDPNTPQSLFLEYKINNLFAGEITAEQRGDIATGSGRLRLRLSWD